MSASLIIILIAVAILALAGGVLLLGGGISGLGFSPRGGVQGSIRAIVAAQRDPNTGRPRHEAHRAAQLADAAKTAKVVEVRTSQVTLQKLLRFAQWKITPLMFRGCEVAISLLSFLVARGIFGIVLQLTALMIGPLFMNWLLLFCVHRRFAAFDKDYPPFLMSLVGLIKTGMNSLSAIDAAAKGLEEDSLVRLEVELMLERLRLGVTEDQSIGGFGEDIMHPEIELFVQALLLSRRVGGNLSDTLERLARQVRKRQQFRQAAMAAVGLQRGSIWVILLVLLGVMMYMFWLAPHLVLGSFGDELGWMVWQTGIVFILLGLHWIRVVTKIKT